MLHGLRRNPSGAPPEWPARWILERGWGIFLWTEASAIGLENLFHKLARAENRAVHKVTHPIPRIIVNPKLALGGDDLLHTLRKNVSTRTWQNVWYSRINPVKCSFSASSKMNHRSTIREMQ